MIEPRRAAEVKDDKVWFRVLHGLPYTKIGMRAVEKHRKQIEYNHAQTLEELDARGGCDWYELYCGFTGRDLFPAVPISTEAARDYVLDRVSRGD